MKLLQALQRHTADNAFILTYNVNLPFFEYGLFDHLYAAGCRNTVVLCDPLPYEQAVRDVPLLRYAGQRYVVLPARTSPRGAFHPKLILLTSRDEGHMYLTSGNLTYPGYAHNLEVTTHVAFSRQRPDPLAWAACDWALHTIDRIADASDVAGVLRERLDQVRQTTPWLRTAPPGSMTDAVWWLHNLDRPLLDQVMDHYQAVDGSPVQEVVFVSPYFDAAAEALDRVLTRFQPQRWRLYTQDPAHHLPTTAVRTVVAHHGIPFESGALDLDGRRLHAKVLLLRTSRGVWVASGSANLSRPAWLERAATGNTEMVSLRFEPDAAYFDPWLDDLTRQATPESLATLGEGWVPDPWVAPRPSDVALAAATLEEGHLTFLLETRLPANATLRVHVEQRDGTVIMSGGWTQGDDLRVTMPLTVLLPGQGGDPLVVSLEVQAPNGVHHWSNPVLLLDLNALRHYRVPLERTPRPSVPAGLVPESHDDCVRLLDLLQGLLVTNQAALQRHAPGRGSLGRQTPVLLELTSEQNDAYDPSAHFVEEPVRRGLGVPGSTVYEDYDARATYDAVLSALLTVVSPTTTPQDRHPVLEDKLPPTPVMEVPVPGDAARQRTRSRIDAGVKRLVRGFEQGASNLDYLNAVSPAYLIELMVILMSYLGVLRRESLLSDDAFHRYARHVLETFWGAPGRSGIWDYLHEHVDLADLATDRTHALLVPLTWMQVSVVATTLPLQERREAATFARWGRYLVTLLGSPRAAIGGLSDTEYRRLWYYSYAPQVAYLERTSLCARVEGHCAVYDERTLQLEIEAWAGARVQMSQDTVLDVRRVPSLDVRVPLSREALDRCWHTFLRFWRWPHPKPNVRARFTSTLDTTDPLAIRTVLLYYLSTGLRGRLVVLVERMDGALQLHVELPHVTLADVDWLDTIDELLVFAQTVVERDDP